MNDLICAKLKEIGNLQDIVKQISYIIKHNVKKFVIIVDMFYLLFLRDIYDSYSTLKDTDDEKRNFAAKLKNLGERKKKNDE